jgi:hypothetical protein
MRLDMLAFDKIGFKLFPPLVTRFKEEAKVDELAAALPAWEAFIVKHLNGGNYLSGGDQPMMLDFHCFPIYERVVMLEDSPWKDAFDKLDFKN